MPEDSRGSRSDTYSCPSCGAELPPDVETCPKCGVSLGPVQFECPNCAAPLDGHERECPKCGTVLEEGGGASDSDLDLMDTVECPSCGTTVDADAPVCPACGQSLEQEADLDLAENEAEEGEETAPPAAAAAGAGAALVNGTGMTNGTGMVNGRGMVNGTGLTNGRGMVNGKGMVNGSGLTNGVGMVNGRGMTNGKGMTNGDGMVNGAGFINGGAAASTHADDGLRGGVLDSEKEEPLLSTRMLIPPRSHRARPLAITLVFVVVLVIVVAMVVMVPRTEEKVKVDGDFGDWDGVARFSDPTSDVASMNVDIEDYAIQTDEGALGVYVQVTGRMLAGADPAGTIDTLLVLLDTDGSAATGYSVMGMGADYAIEVSGWDGDVHTAALKEFTTGRPTLDWNGFESLGAVSASASGTALELEASDMAQYVKADKLRFVLAMQTADRGTDWTAVTGTTPGALVVAQAALGVDGEHLAAGGSYSVLRLNLNAIDADAAITAISVSSARVPAPTILDLGNCQLCTDSDHSGDWTDSDVVLVRQVLYGSGNGGSTTFGMAQSPLTISAGSSARLFVVVEVAGTATPGLALKLHVASRSDIATEHMPVTVWPVAGMASYIDAPATTVAIDGLFEDWHALLRPGGGLANVTDPLGDVTRADIDLERFAQFDEGYPAGGGRALFYARSDPDGRMLAGTTLPLLEVGRPGAPGPPGPPGPGPGRLPELIGEDVAVFYLAVSGATPTLSFMGLQASHKVEVHGTGGVVTSAVLYRYAGPTQGPWTEMTNAVRAAAGGQELEVSVDLAGIGDVVTALVVMQGWDGAVDYGAPSPVGPLGGDDSRHSPPVPWDDVPIPEFGQLVLPALATIVAFAVLRRRSARAVATARHAAT